MYVQSVAHNGLIRFYTLGFVFYFLSFFTKIEYKFDSFYNLVEI